MMVYNLFKIFELLLKATECDEVQLGRKVPTFRRHLLLPFIWKMISGIRFT